MMPVADFLASPEAVPALRERLTYYLEGQA